MAADISSSDADRDNLDHVFSVAYEELLRLAALVKRGDPAATVSPGTLVNEAWIKLSRKPSLAGAPPVHFKRIAARAMRHVLVSAARRRSAGKRGAAVSVCFDEVLAAPARDDGELLTLDDALSELTRLNPRQGQIVESRFFGGLETGEIAGLLGVSESTVLRDWRAARAWLAAQLER